MLHGFRLFCAAALAVTCAGAVAAQTQQPLSDELRAQQERQRARTTAETAEPGLTIETGARPVVGTEEFCVPVASIQVNGITVLPDDIVNAAVNEYARSCMGQKAIDSLLQVLSDLYVERGYITSRAYIPEQDLSDGVLEIVVVEGRVEDIIFINSRNGEPLEAPRASRVRRAVPLDPGDLLELRALEQGMDQMNSPAGSTVGVDIQPGQELGGSILVITAEDNDLWRGAVRYQLQRGNDIEDETIGLSLTTDNLLNINDSWSMSLNGGLNSNALSLGVTVPLRNWTWTAGLSYSEQLSQLTATTDLFEQTVSFRLAGSFLLSRDERQKTFAGFTFVSTDIDRSINGTDLEEQSNNTATLSFDREIVGEGSFTGLGLRTTFGNRRGTDSYMYAQASAQHFRSLADEWSLYVTGDVQLSGDTLPNGDRFYIGGSGLVRGFEGQSLSGDRGFAVTSEFGLTIPWETECCVVSSGPGRWVSEAAREARPYLFADLGYVTNFADGASATMVSAGFGLRTQILNTGLDLSVGFPVLAHGNARETNAGIRLALSRKLF